MHSFMENFKRNYPQFIAFVLLLGAIAYIVFVKQ